MKGEYFEPNKPEPSSTTTPNLFTKLHHPHHHHPFSPHHFPVVSPPSHDSSTTTPSDKHKPSSTNTPNPIATPSLDPTSGDGATIEVVRRPRGRPPGSKNKPKPPVVITREPPEPTMSPYILEVPGGTDVVDSISRFCRRKSIGLCVLSGSGTVANFTLRQPSTAPPATVTFHGRFDILSVSATFFPPQPTPSFRAPNVFTISLAGPQGQIVGGSVAGPLIAAGSVFVVAASFNAPTFHRLSDGEESEGGGRGRAASGGGSGGDGQSPPGSSGGDSGGQQPPHAEASCMYGGHLGSDAIWALVPRQPPPPY